MCVLLSAFFRDITSTFIHGFQNIFGRVVMLEEEKCHVKHFIFSSPEHEVLMVSYCDKFLSVVQCPCIVNFLL